MSSYNSVEDLRDEIIERYTSLSTRLQQVAKYVIDYEHDFAIETVATIAKRSDVQPSAVVRFAKEFGFSGASSMQRLFREKLISDKVSASYRGRIRSVADRSDDASSLDLPTFLYDFLDASVESLKSHATEAQAATVYQIAQELASSDTVYVAGHRRSFPVSSYFAYALGKAGKKVILVDGIGGMAMEQVQSCAKNDLLIATSFSPYASETVSLVERAKANGTRIALLSDSEVSPIARIADTTLIIRDAEIFGFRALSSSLCIAQAIIVSFVALSETP